MSKNEIGKMIDNYSISKQLGRGAFGAVYLGIDTKNGDQAAIKTLDLHDKHVYDFDFLKMKRFSFL